MKEKEYIDALIQKNFGEVKNKEIVKENFKTFLISDVKFKLYNNLNGEFEDLIALNFKKSELVFDGVDSFDIEFYFNKGKFEVLSKIYKKYYTKLKMENFEFETIISNDSRSYIDIIPANCYGNNEPYVLSLASINKDSFRSIRAEERDKITIKLSDVMRDNLLITGKTHYMVLILKKKQ